MRPCSRARLRVAGEQVHEVHPLTVQGGHGTHGLADAVALFDQVATAVDPHFDLVHHVDDVAAICRAVDGLPLAIEIAGGHLRTLSPSLLRERLTSRLGSAAGAGRHLPDRQQTIPATIDWSLQLLGPAERRLFGLFSVFHGAVSLEAVQREIEAKRIQDEERRNQEVIKAKAVMSGPKQVGTIDLNPKKPAAPVPAPAPSDSKPEEKPVAAQSAPVEPQPAPAPAAEAPAAEPAQTPGAPAEKPTEEFATQYKKLSGTTLTGQTIDLSQFEKPKKKKEDLAIRPNTAGANSAANKNKRKRIPTKPGDARPGFGGGAGGQRTGGGAARRRLRRELGL